MTADKSKIIKDMRAKLNKSIVSNSGDKNTRFFKVKPGEYGAHDQFLGVSNPAVRAVAKEVKNDPPSLPEIQLLLDSKFNEERFLGLVVLIDMYNAADEVTQEAIYQFYLSNTRNVNNWNLVDCSAYFIVGPHLLNKDRSILLTLAASPSLWERRIAIVATNHFIRNKDLEWTYKLAQLLLKDEEDLMHKATGWMLREAGKKDTPSLRVFLDAHAREMPRTMLRYAIEKFDSTTRKHYLSIK
jgi:3-methyladenine DNA glycosylase AlkD